MAEGGDDLAQTEAAEAQRFGLFEGLEEQPYGALPIGNLNAKGGPTSIKQYKRLASYNWFFGDNAKPTIITPGAPLEFVGWKGGQLPNDEGVLMYDIHHAKMPFGPLDPLFLSLLKAQPDINFQDFDIITDAVNLQKLFAFCKNDGEGLFRVDAERIGKTMLLNRVEPSDYMQIDYETYDQHLKQKCCRAAGQLTAGPHFQISSYQFGDFKMLVRHEVDAVEYDAKMGAPPDYQNAQPTAHSACELNPDVEVVALGEMKKTTRLMCLTTYPQGAGFPFFTWAQLFFSGADAALVGWYKGRGDFGKPAIYALPDINKMLKPLPYPILGKVHDCLAKVYNFLKCNSMNLRVGLVWKGGENLEIYQRNEHNQHMPVTKSVKEFLVAQSPPTDGCIPEEK